MGAQEGGAGRGEHLPEDDVVASIVRPYALTKGRTAPTIDLPLEATVELVDADLARTDVERAIVELCTHESPSVAEISARLHQPLGVTRVLLADLVGSGSLRVRATLTDRVSDQVRHDLIERTLRGLRAL